MQSRNKFRLSYPIPCLIAAGLLALAGPAGATISRNQVQVRLEGPPRAAEPGKPFEAVLEIRAASDVTLEEFFINTGRSWRLSAGNVPGSLTLTRGEIRRIPFTVITDDPAEPLHIEYQLGDKTVRKAVDLSPEGVQAAKPGGLVAVEDLLIPGILESSIDPAPLRAEAPAASDRLVDHELVSKAAETKDRLLSPASYNVRIVGFFTYRRMNDNAPVGVDGAVARVYDEDTTWDELLATQVLGPDGRLDVTFNWDPCFGCDGTPDIYVEFELENAEIDVHDDSIWESDYTFETGVWQDFGGAFLDIGAQTPGNTSLFPACHIMTHAIRAWRFTADMGRDTPKVDYQWPDNDGCGACYDDDLEEIYIDSSRQWNENTIVHEFGHHWANTFAVITTPNYCPSTFCNSSGCGHCIWCQETATDAFNEGFANYYQDVVMRTSVPNPVTAARTYEALQRCTDSGVNVFHDPWTTEGFFAALLHDVEDGGNEDEPNQPKGKDELSLGYDEIFWIVDQRHPLTPSDFINWFRMDYPNLKEPFWATAINNGYQTDSAPPGNVTNITSDHTLNQNWETRPNIKWFWNRAADDASGIQGYSYYVTSFIPTWLPDETVDILDVTELTTGPHPPGWYYIALRARDRDGNWSPTYEWNGPYGIRAADPANLTVPIHSNWDYLGVTARHIPDATEFDTQAPVYLPGEGPPSYLSCIYKNDGEQATSVDQRWIDFYLDLYQIAYNHHLGYLNPGVYNYVLNQPVTITGGRHVLGVRLDDSDFMSEPNEVDNQWARQWAWNPPDFNLGPPAYYPSPPPPYQGTEWIVDGSAYYQNCRGFRSFDEVNVPNTMWTAWTLHAPDGADYDMSVYASSSSPTDAFTSWVSGSYRVAYDTDIFLFNSWQFWGSPIVLDYGIVNYSGGIPWANGFYFQKVTSQSLTFPGSTSDVLGANEMLKLYQYYSPGGNVFARVQVQDPSLGQVYLTLVPQAFVYGPLLGAGTTVVSDPATGLAVINESQAGYQCLAVWRDPDMGTGNLSITVTVQSTPADLAVVTPPGWGAPLVPRPANDGTPGSVPVPGYLLGEYSQTWLNYAVANQGMAGVPPIPQAALYVDGAAIFTETPPWPDPGQTTYRNLSTPFQVRGGRHALGVHLDYAGQTGEMSDDNNYTAAQWVWLPPGLPFDLTQARPAPADRFAGWDLMPAGTPLWFNADGQRTYPSSPDGADNGWKVAAFAIPDAGMDVDLKLYELASDALNGFDVELASSSWGIDQADFVIADFRTTTPRQFDVGFLAPAVQPGASLAQFRTSKYLGSGPAVPAAVQPAGLVSPGPPAAGLASPGSLRAAAAAGTHGPFTIGAGDLFDLYEADLPAGTYQIGVVPGTGPVDWGIAVYGPGSAFLSRSETLPGGTAWEAPAGSPDQFSVTVEQAGPHAIVVWKNARSDVYTSGSFTIQITQNTTGVPDEPSAPVVSLIQTIRPNPFAGSTQVEVRLERPSEVSLHVFDAVGRRLFADDLGRLEAGRHAFGWDGRDVDGEPVPAGIYFVRVIAGPESDVRKIVRVR